MELVFRPPSAGWLQTRLIRSGDRESESCASGVLNDPVLEWIELALAALEPSAGAHVVCWEEPGSQVFELSRSTSTAIATWYSTHLHPPIHGGRPRDAEIQWTEACEPAELARAIWRAIEQIRPTLETTTGWRAFPEQAFHRLARRLSERSSIPARFAATAFAYPNRARQTPSTQRKSRALAEELRAFLEPHLVEVEDVEAELSAMLTDLQILGHPLVRDEDAPSWRMYTDRPGANLTIQIHWVEGIEPRRIERVEVRWQRM